MRNSPMLGLAQASPAPTTAGDSFVDTPLSAADVASVLTTPLSVMGGKMDGSTGPSQRRQQQQRQTGGDEEKADDDAGAAQREATANPADDDLDGDGVRQPPSPAQSSPRSSSTARLEDEQTYRLAYPMPASPPLSATGSTEEPRPAFNPAVAHPAACSALSRVDLLTGSAFDPAKTAPAALSHIPTTPVSEFESLFTNMMMAAQDGLLSPTDPLNVNMWSTLGGLGLGPLPMQVDEPEDGAALDGEDEAADFVDDAAVASTDVHASDIDALRQECLQRQSGLEAKLKTLVQTVRVQQRQTILAHAQASQDDVLAREATLRLTSDRSSGHKRLFEHEARDLKHAALYKDQLKFLDRQVDPEATESSSYETSDSEDDAEVAVRQLRKRRKVQSRWDRARADVGWRWTWLRHRITVLEADISSYRDLARRVRAEKRPLYESEAEEAACARELPLRPGKRRALCHPPTPAAVSGSLHAGLSEVRLLSGLSASDPRVIQLKAHTMDRAFHPVLSFVEDAPLPVLLNSRRRLRTLQFKREEERRARKCQEMSLAGQAIVCDPLHSASSAFTARIFGGNSSMIGRRIKPSSHRLSARLLADDTVICTPSPRPSPLDLSNSCGSFRRRRLTELDIDDVMISPLLAPSHVEPLCVKEILTPAWKVVASTLAAASSSSLPEAPQPQSQADAEQPAASAPLSADALPATDAALLELTAEHVMEDLSDEAYARRHLACEENEKLHFFGAVLPGAQPAGNSGGGSNTRRPSGEDVPARRLREIRMGRDTISVPAFETRLFPLTGRDLAALDVPLVGPFPDDGPEAAPVPRYTVITKCDDGEQPVGGLGGPEAPSLSEGNIKPIKLVLKLSKDV